MSVVYEEENPFANDYATNKDINKPSTSKYQKPPPEVHKKDTLPHHTLSKMLFPNFDGTQPKVWITKCNNYFNIYSIPEHLWVQAASMHLEGNAAKWWEAYKLTNPTVSWHTFCTTIQSKFGGDDYRNAINGLLTLRQTGSVEEYTTEFQAIQYDIAMHGGQLDYLFMASTYVNGLKEKIKAMVEPQVPTTVDKAITVAKIQQKIMERSKSKFQKTPPAPKPPPVKQDKPQGTYGTLWRDKQLRDYRKENNLCFRCGEKFKPGHAKVCTKKNKPQLNALVLNDLDKELSEDLLNEMAIEEVLTEDFCQLSLNALAGTDSHDCIKLKSTVKDYVDIGSTHNFISAQFVNLTKLPIVPMQQQQVKLANGQWMATTTQVKNLQWYIQGKTFTTDMIVLDTLPYDAILGYDWMKRNSPMTCDWQAKTMQFVHQGRQVTLQGITDPSP